MSRKMYTVTDHRGVPVEIPDGMWVVTTRDGYESAYDYGECDDTHGPCDWRHEDNYQLLGLPEGVRLLEVVTSDYGWSGWVETARVSNRSRAVVLACTRQFAVVETTCENWQEQPGRRVLVAQQVHEGRLGLRPAIRHPRLVREAGTPDGWVNVAELVALSGMRLEDLVKSFFPFTSPSVPTLTAVIDGPAEAPDEVSWSRFDDPVGRKVQIYERNFEVLFAADPTRCYVYKSWAEAVLYLILFKHIPAPAARTT